MNANESESNHKKKLIVPIIAIMLCAVAVIGAGYAYQSSLSLKDNSLDGGNITVTLNTGEGDAHPVFYKGDNKLDVVFTQEIVYAMDGGQYVPTVNTVANGVDTSNSSTLGTLSVKYSNTTGKDVYAYVSVKVSASSIMVGNTSLDLSSIVNGISISPIGGTNIVVIGLSDMGGTKEFNLYGEHELLGTGVVEGKYSVVLNVNTGAFTEVGGDQDSMNKLIEELEKITFEITVNISDVDPNGSA